MNKRISKDGTCEKKIPITRIHVQSSEKNRLLLRFTSEWFILGRILFIIVIRYKLEQALFTENSFFCVTLFSHTKQLLYLNTCAYIFLYITHYIQRMFVFPLDNIYHFFNANICVKTNAGRRATAGLVGRMIIHIYIQ